MSIQARILLSVGIHERNDYEDRMAEGSGINNVEFFP
jgi:hypothetical protein